MIYHKISSAALSIKENELDNFEPGSYNDETLIYSVSLRGFIRSNPEKRYFEAVALEKNSPKSIHEKIPNSY